MSELPKKLAINRDRTDIGYLDEMGLFNHIATLDLANEFIHRYACHDELVAACKKAEPLLEEGQRGEVVSLHILPKDTKYHKPLKLIKAALAEVEKR